MKFRDFIEGKQLSLASMRREGIPETSVPENIAGWRVWFVNKFEMPEIQFSQIVTQDKQMLAKLIAVLLSIGVRKHNRVPVVMSYQRNDMEAFGLASNTKVGSWEPINSPTKGVAAVKKTLGKQSPGRTVNRSATAFNQKNKWMFGAVRQIQAKIGRRTMTVGSFNLPPSIVSQLGDSTDVSEVLGEFLSVMGGRLEQLSPADRHAFLKTVFNSLSQG